MQLIQRLEIIGQTVAQVFRLAYVNDPAFTISPLVYARCAGMSDVFGRNRSRESPSRGAPFLFTSLPGESSPPTLKPSPFNCSAFCAKPPGCAARWVRSQHALKELAGPRLFALSHLFRRTFGNDGAASVTAFRPKVDDPIGRLDHIEIVFNDNNGIALIHQSLQDKQQFAHIFKMQTRGRFVKIYTVLPVDLRCNSVASFTRCDSPPESVGAGCPSRIYPSPTCTSVSR